MRRLLAAPGLDHPVAIALLLVIGAFGTATLAMTMIQGLPGGNLNADSLGAMHLARDLLEDPANWFFWRVPKAPMLATDVLPWFLILQVEPRPDHAFYLFVLQQIAALFLLSGLLVACFAERAPKRAALLAMLPFALIFALMAYDLASLVSPYSRLFISQFHQSTGIWTLAIAILGVVAYRRGAGILWLLGLGLALIALVMGDTLLSVWIAGPLFLVFAVVGWHPSTEPAARRSARRVAVTAVAGTIGGVLASEMLYKPDSISFASMEQFAGSLTWPWRFHLHMVEHFGIGYFLAVLLPLILCVLLSGRALLRSPGTWSNAEFLALTVVLGTLASFGALVLTGLLDGHVVPRYMMQLFTLPVAVALLWLADLWPRVAGIAGTATAVVILILGLAAVPKVGEAQTVMRLEPHGQTCARQYFPEATTLAGLSSYWDARPVDIYGDGTLHLVAITETGGVHHWSDSGINAFPFAVEGGGRRAVDLQFLYFTDRLSEAGLINHFGEPTQRLACPKGELWLFDQTPDQLFAKVFASYYGSKVIDRALLGAGRLELPTSALRVEPGDPTSALAFRAIKGVDRIQLLDQDGVNGRVILER